MRFLIPSINSNNNTVFKGVDLHSDTNNNEHHTSEISVKQLIVRRGQSFILTLKLVQPFNPDKDQLTMTVSTGEYPSEDLGTKSCFCVPDKVIRSASAKAVWKADLQKSSSPETGILTLTITPPADAPIGDYKLSAKHKNEEKELANLSVLFNPWCPDDGVFLPDEAERQEYVMNENGIVYRGSDNYISPMHWNFGQFEEDMVKICFNILDFSVKHMRNPAADVSARCSPVYISRIITNMIHSESRFGVLQGNWSNNYGGGFPPTHWNSSYTILKQWYDSLYQTVKYGQCWVFASVMCSVMRLLGIPCRVVTNFKSAHDTDKNLTIDTYYNNSGKVSADSIWNFHVWVEGWMKRPDLAQDGRYDGWQVLDPTPQEKSDGMFCCGPASVAAILNGDTHLKYDVPFVFAEVNADCVTWMVLPNLSKKRFSSDTRTVGQHISTKAVGLALRADVTNSYKYQEGSEEERAVFSKALSMLNSRVAGMARRMARAATEDTPLNNSHGEPVPPQLAARFEEVSKPVNGEDVNLKLILSSASSDPMLLTINISVQALKYTGQPAGNIQTVVMEQKLLPGEELSIPVLLPFDTYQNYLKESKSINFSAMITDQEKTENIFLAETLIVLQDPTISISVSDDVRVNHGMTVKVEFKNPVNKILRDCKLTVCGSGLVMGENITRLPNLPPNNEVHVELIIVPYKEGEKTLLVNFDCNYFRDVKANCVVQVQP